MIYVVSPCFFFLESFYFFCFCFISAETVATKFIWYNDDYIERIPTSAYSNLEKDIFSLEEKALEKILDLLRQDDLWFSPSCQTVFKRGELYDFSDFKIN